MATQGKAHTFSSPHMQMCSKSLYRSLSETHISLKNFLNQNLVNVEKYNVKLYIFSPEINLYISSLNKMWPSS